MLGAISKQFSDHSQNSYMTASLGGPREQARTAEEIREAAVPPLAEADDESKKQPAESSRTIDTVKLSKNETKEVQELKSRDQEVRKHEQAHKAVAGRYAVGSMSFSFQVGPDGKRYAVGGEVGIDLSKGQTPEKTIQKAATVRAAALAPAEPSGQDRKVAAMASRMEQEARQELSVRQQEKADRVNPTDSAEVLSNMSSVASSAPETESQTESSNSFASPQKTEELPGTNSKTSMNETGRQDTHDPVELQRNENQNQFENMKPNPAIAVKKYQENTPSSLSPVDTTTAGMVMLSMAI